MIDVIPGRNVYPTFGGPSLGDIATGDSIGPFPAEIETGQAEVDAALAVGGQASPLMGALVFLLLIVATMWVMHRFGRDGEFANIKASAYNALIISWIAILGIPIWKALFTRVKVPGISTWVHAV